MHKNRPFTRAGIVRGQTKFLARGRWANADLMLCRVAGSHWVVKDFSACPDPIKNTWGVWMVRREFNAFLRLAGLDGIPAQPFLVDRYAVAYRFMPGKTLRDISPDVLTREFFLSFESLVLEMHARGLVHLDLRNRRNILFMDNGRPGILDFQSYINLCFVPGFLHRLLKEIDLSGVYKIWNNSRPDLMDKARMDRLFAMNRKRGLWVLKGYPMGTKGRRRGEE
ncbi:MAG: hypothetical protein GXP53_14585 [Deltaproteobacteria bacterium]|nr:hypothetical protein [Deltaproteobacteria bacterium]